MVSAAAAIRRQEAVAGRTTGPTVESSCRDWGSAPGVRSDRSGALASTTFGKWTAQVILRWLTQRGVVAIPKSVRMERIGGELRRDPNMVKMLSEAQRGT